MAEVQKGSVDGTRSYTLSYAQRVNILTSIAMYRQSVKRRINSEGEPRIVEILRVRVSELDDLEKVLA